MEVYGEILCLVRSSLNFVSDYIKEVDTYHVSFSYKQEVIKKLSPKIVWQPLMKWTVTSDSLQLNIKARKAGLPLVNTNTDSGSLAQQSWSITWQLLLPLQANECDHKTQPTCHYANSLEPDETPRNSASHPDLSCLTSRQQFHQLWATLKQTRIWANNIFFGKVMANEYDHQAIKPLNAG